MAHARATSSGARPATRCTRTRRCSASSPCALAPPEPQLQHAALRLTARGWETAPLPAPNGSGALVVALDLHAPRGGRRAQRRRERGIPLTPDRPVGEVTRDVLAAVRELGGPGRDRPDAAGGAVDACRSTRTRSTRRYDPGQVADLLRRGHPRRAGAGRVPRALPRPLDAGQRLVGLVRPGGQPLLGRARRAALGRLHHAQRDGRRRRSRSAGGPATRSYGSAAFYAYAHPAPRRLRGRRRSRRPRRAGTPALGEYILDWDDVCAAPDPQAYALEFAHSAFRHACSVCEWDPSLLASAEGSPPPVH